MYLFIWGKGGGGGAKNEILLERLLVFKGSEVAININLTEKGNLSNQGGSSGWGWSQE